MSAELSMLLDVRRVKKDAVYPVKLRVYYQAKAVLHPTVFNLTQEDYQKLDAKRTSDHLLDIRAKLNEILQQARTAAEAIHPFDFQQFFTRFIYEHPRFMQKKRKVEKLVEQQSPDILPEEWLKWFPILKLQHPYPNAISVIYAEIVKSLLHQARVGKAIAYQDSYYSYAGFRGNVRVSAVTADYLHEYEAWMLRNGKSMTTVGMYARALRAVVNKAIRKKLLTKDQYPFGREQYLIPNGRNVKKAIERRSIARLYHADLDKECQERARDYWFYIYYGNGMNIKDFVQLKYKNIVGEYLIFERAKTALTSRGRDPIIVSAFITEDMRRIMEKWGNKDKHPDNYIFPVLRSGMTPIEEYEAKKSLISIINNNLRKVGVKKKLECEPRTNDARHSTATNLKNAGAPILYIKEALGHANVKTTENYLAGFENEQKKEFAKMLDRFKT